MTYATRQDLEGRYGAEEISQRESQLDPVAVARALSDADALIDGYLRGRYAVPLTAVPPDLVTKACAIARYQLLGDAVTERAKDDYKEAIAWLRDIQAGRVKLDVQIVAQGEATANLATIVTSPSVFKREGRP